MEYRHLEINVISAKDLKYVNHFTKMDVYAVVTINGDHRTAQRTPIHKDCGSNAEWNYHMKFTIDEGAAQKNRLHLVFRLKSYRLLGDKEIGEVHAPIKELLDHNNGNGNGKVERNVSYNVRLPNGEAKGILNFSFKFGEKFEKSVLQPHVPGAAGAMNVDNYSEKPVIAYPPTPAGYPRPSVCHPPPTSTSYSTPTSASYPPPTSASHPPPTSTSYPPPSASYPPPTSAGHHSPPRPGAYPPPPQGMAGYPYPPPGGYPPQYGYPRAPAPGYGYPAYGYPSQGGHGYPPVQKPQKPKKNGKSSGFGLGLAGGLLGGMLVGDMIGDAFEAVEGFDCDMDIDF